ncbi:MAG: hypothetical protein WCU00_05475 [Candidatus Latescibacterota bacterium]
MRAAHITFFFLLYVIVSGIAQGDEPKLPKPEITLQDSTRLLIPLPFFSKVGFQSGFVFTNNFDTGVDFGTVLGKDYYLDFIELCTTLHVWGATNDSTDVASGGLDASLTYKIPIKGGVTSFAGFMLGYYAIHKVSTISKGSETQTVMDNHFYYQTFITAGAEYYMKENRTLFFQLKYGITDLSREVHVLFGINFYSQYKQFKTWTVPPLMR